MAKRKRPRKKKKQFSPLPAIAAVVLILAGATIGLILFLNTPERKLARTLSGGEKQMASGDYIRAIDAYRNALKIDEKNETAYRGLVDACGAYGDPQGVYDAYRQSQMYLAPEQTERLRMAAASRILAIGEAYFSGGNYDNTRAVTALLKEIDETAAAALTDRVIEVTAPKVGSGLVFGSLNGTQLEWTVLERQGARVLLCCTTVVDTRPFTETVVGVSWAYATLRQYLNKEWLTTVFTAEEQGKIALAEVNHPALATETVTYARNATEDRVFLLSVQELQTHFPNDSDRALGTPYWTRTSTGRSDTGAIIVTETGAFAEADVRDEPYGVRPAIWMILE